MEVGREVGLGAGVAVVDNEVLEVVGNGGGLVVGHAGATIIVTVLLAGDEWASERCNSEKACGESECAHVGGISGI